MNSYADWKENFVLYSGERKKVNADVMNAARNAARNAEKTAVSVMIATDTDNKCGTVTLM